MIKIINFLPHVSMRENNRRLYLNKVFCILTLILYLTRFDQKMEFLIFNSIFKIKTLNIHLVKKKYHFFVPSADLTLTLRRYSLSSQFDVFPKKTVRQSRKRNLCVMEQELCSIIDVRGEGTYVKKHPE